MDSPVTRLLPDGRLHLQHGPIDLVIQAYGAGAEVRAAYAQATAFFQTVLTDLVARLPDLRRPARARAHALPISIADHMNAAAAWHLPVFVTPMACVAGAVADGVLAALTADRVLDRAYVNNGGDIAVYLSPGTGLTAAGGPTLADRIDLTADGAARGLATSGWRGRSHSLGIADAVSVLARTAAEADVAATLIANAVDLPGHPAITRTPACDLAPDSDLGPRPVTTAVGALTNTEIAMALTRGSDTARQMQSRGLILGAALWLGGQVITTGHPLLTQKDPVHA